MRAMAIFLRPILLAALRQKQLSQDAWVAPPCRAQRPPMTRATARAREMKHIKARRRVQGARHRAGASRELTACKGLSPSVTQSTQRCCASDGRFAERGAA